ncbi:flagellar biosynthetic protein FliR [Paenibacillus sp. BIHB 4019]|uniref:Flagellar biosynthetic protein FliR n=1 Tax=Paenibacillus sp. BIHB 4019 TaxID=1870819 RepID=A0A1B2DPM8_9BACL|nr:MULTISPECIES: flagellar biosynthetic protein FliR [unclassified Paenibacillus]ANY69660.1 flagellar biosynthetic protein FliR [Paenibacillus sp. BIHB 4019]KQO04407.1 flagellar biosynthetic protein FliR [Paenibacillus sp. Leaf72]
MELIEQGFPIFLLIFCRITSFFVVAPMFSGKMMPNIAKIGLSFFISFIVYLTYGINQTVATDASYVLYVVQEILIGLLFGFVVYLFFVVVQTAGALMDLQIGFAMANVVNPLTGTSVPLLGNFKYMMLIVIFFSLNGHHYLLRGLMDSYKWMPLAGDFFARISSGSISEFLTKAVGNTFLLALQVAAPLVIAMFLTDVGLAFLAKTAPQYNVFVIGIPLKLIIGTILLVLLMPGLSGLYERLIAIMFDNLEQLFAIFKGPDG